VNGQSASHSRWRSRRRPSDHNTKSADSRTVVVVGRGQHPLAACFATANAHHLRSDGVRWRSLVTEKCPNDHVDLATTALLIFC
jgi:hypothetical protein